MTSREYRAELCRRILALLAEKPALTTNELARVLDARRAEVWSVCDALERRGRLDRFRTSGSSSVLWAIRRSRADA